MTARAGSAFVLFGALLVAGLGLAGCGAGSGTDWEAVHALISSRYPDVPSLTTDELARMLADDATHVVLVDARTPEEYAVSHLDGAHLAPTVDDVVALRETVPPSTVIVAYCSVGYRSAALVHDLRAAGLDDVFNLTGSVFAWANEGRPVYRDKTRVEEVHPFDQEWGQLLDRRYWPQSWRHSSR